MTTGTTFRNYFEYIRLQLEFPKMKRKTKRGEKWEDHLARLEQQYTSGSRSGLTYRVVAQVLNAANFAVPQRRERIFFVGFRDDILHC